MRRTAPPVAAVLKGVAQDAGQVARLGLAYVRFDAELFPFLKALGDIRIEEEDAHVEQDMFGALRHLKLGSFHPLHRGRHAAAKHEEKKG